jgi:hypothetical protein
MSKVKPSRLDRRVDGVACALIFTLLVFVFISMVLFGAKGADSGLLCNGWYCLITYKYFITSRYLLVATVISLIIFYRLGYRHGFTKTLSFFYQNKDKDY